MRGLWLPVCVASMMAAAPVSGSEYKDTTFGYSVTPPDFPAPPPGSVAMQLNVLAPPEAGFAANMGVMIQEIRVTRDEFIALSEQQSAAAGMKIRSTKKRDVSGLPAVVFDFEGQVGGHSLRFLQLAVIQPQRVLLLTYTAEASTFGGHEKEFRRSLESFKLTPR